MGQGGGFGGRGDRGGGESGDLVLLWHFSIGPSNMFAIELAGNSAHESAGR